MNDEGIGVLGNRELVLSGVEVWEKFFLLVVKIVQKYFLENEY
jgi:hypothetical protein